MIHSAGLESLLYKEGASLVGFGDISALEYQGFTACVSIAVKIPAQTVSGIANGPAEDYYRQYHSLNAKLDALAEAAAQYLARHGCRALAWERTGHELTLCGKCIEACPYARAYINEEELR